MGAVLVVVLASLAMGFCRLERMGDAAAEAASLKSGPGAQLYGALDFAHQVFQPDKPGVAEAAGAEEPALEESLPFPAPRLPQCGTSFVVPISGMANCECEQMSFDITVRPAVWPFHANLSRPKADVPWHRLELTVDIIAAAAMPPLFSCRLTGGPGGGRRLEVINSAGALEGTIQVQRDGCCELVRDGKPPWAIEVSHSWIVVRRGLQELAITTWRGGGAEEGVGVECLQVDAQPEPESRESALLLLCVLAMVAFRRGSAL